MWVLVVLFSVAAAVGSLMLTSESGETPAATLMDDHLARNMAIYRRAVIDHVQANPAFTGSVDDAAMDLPQWYVRHPGWRNEVLADGTVLVYGPPVSPSLGGRLAVMSSGSMLAGEARQHADGATYLFSALQGDTGIALPTLDAGTVVWLARRD